MDDSTQQQDQQRQEFERWCQERQDAVRGPAGNLALVGFVPVGEQDERLDQIPAAVRREPGADDVIVTADAADGVHLDGELVDGERRWARLRPDGTPLLTWEGMTADAFSLDGSAFEVRVYDQASPGRENFDHIEVYPYDPALVVPATFVADEATQAVPWEFSRDSDSGSVKQVPGRIRFALGGQEHELVGFLDGPILVIVFADGTTGAESYAPGRFLKMEIPAGEFQLDLNHAFIPPCGFSSYYSCPLPPAGNRMTVPVRGGERRVVWKDGVDGVHG